MTCPVTTLPHRHSRTKLSSLSTTYISQKTSDLLQPLTTPSTISKKKKNFLSNDCSTFSSLGDGL
ncbi:hypothetical protein CROQUDRAFT_202972 [Cronartium quercuum f. sp. fusiforme G11]|uniref:Uncharacterized protein n=1 Tax=Cronartium quercuum f. sp. fusiforme G11 TaxID=708437 RepID=A0A9P6T8Z8_9BASI|nr:hypothetical protein CROQUDRAFT_202972 [Cronartium quercuum f. sp. fusiforme G11]